MSKLALVTGFFRNRPGLHAAAGGRRLRPCRQGWRRDRLEELVATLTSVKVEPLTADLSTDEGVDEIAAVCAQQPLTMLVSNACVAHYMPFAELPADKAHELVHVKVAVPVMLTRAAVPGMIERGEGTIINVAGMIAFSGPAPQAQLLCPRHER